LAELVDALDLKSNPQQGLSVQVR